MKVAIFLLVLGGAFGLTPSPMTENHFLNFTPHQAHAHSGATGIVKDRMDRFKASQDALKAIAAVLKSGDFAAIEAPAQSIAQWGDEMVGYFPEGSNPSPSEARDEIWQEMKQFSAMAAANAAAARRLLDLAKTDDPKAIKSGLNDLVGSCKACHQKFRQ